MTKEEKATIEGLKHRGRSKRRIMVRYDYYCPFEIAYLPFENKWRIRDLSIDPFKEIYGTFEVKDTWENLRERIIKLIKKKEMVEI